MDFKLGIIFYISTILAILMFMFPWHIYLHRVNIKLNQTIQILNVVPMALLPVGRKETRDFLKWLVKKASEVQTGSES